MSDNEPLDQDTHQMFLERMEGLLREILKEIKGLRSDIDDLNREISHKA
jgi:hypothetical protein